MENLIENKTLFSIEQWEQKANDKIDQKRKALVYCENQFGLPDGKTAAALVRHSELYSIVGINENWSTTYTRNLARNVERVTIPGLLPR